MTAQPRIAPDTKDWTWVLERTCPECGFDAAALPRDQVGPCLQEAAEALVRALEAPGATERPSPHVWSVLEYACHARDVCRVFAERLHRMLTEDDPAFANWDQDATAEQDGYAEQEPGVVARQLRAESRTLAGAWQTVPAGAWDRPGRRSDGSAFTVLSLGRYLAHDLVHHVRDVARQPSVP